MEHTGIGRSLACGGAPMTSTAVFGFKVKTKQWPAKFCVAYEAERSNHMFAVLNRPVQRQVLIQYARWMSQVPPPSAEAPRLETPEATVDTTSQPGATPSLDFSPPDIHPTLQKDRERTGAKSSKGSLSASEKRRQNIGKLSLGFLGLSLGLGIFYMGRNWEEDELKRMKLVSEFSVFIDAILKFSCIETRACPPRTLE